MFALKSSLFICLCSIKHECQEYDLFFHEIFSINKLFFRFPQSVSNLISLIVYIILLQRKKEKKKYVDLTMYFFSLPFPPRLYAILMSHWIIVTEMLRKYFFFFFSLRFSSFPLVRNLEENLFPVIFGEDQRPCLNFFLFAFPSSLFSPSRFLPLLVS